jgi:cellulase/cellobiase CelA1
LPWWGATHSDANGLPVEDPASTGINNRTDVFPRQLKHVTSIPSTWTIAYPSMSRTDPLQTWDASFDIWFDKTGTPNSGHAGANIYANTTIRGQNDGLEIMVWMDHNHSYVDSPEGTDPVAEPAGRPNVAGYAQPSGWLREVALIGGVYYDVWTSRLNNAYYGYTTNQQIAAGGHLWECPTLAVNGGPGAVCGADWNVVSFVAKKDYRKQSMTLDAKVFTDYILGKSQGCTTTGGVEQCMWKIFEQKHPWNRDGNGLLQCPTGSMDNQQAHPMATSTGCLAEAWVLTSVMAGFETWIGGNGLETTGFQTAAWVANAAIQSGRLNDAGQPAVFWGAPFEVAYAGCPVGTTSGVSFYVSLPDGTTWPATPTGGTVTPQPMGAQQANGLFVYTVPALYPMHGPATVHFISACGNSDLTMFIDPSGQVFYSDGVTPVPGAMATLVDTSTGDDVPNRNEGLGTSPVMQPDDNTLNGMPTDKWGSYGWNVVPGQYQVRAELKGCGSVTSPTVTVISDPIMNLNLTLPCAPPPAPPLPPTGNLAVTLSIFNNWTSGGPNGTGGYCATVEGTNNTGAALDWTAAFTLPEPGTIYDFWNATYTQSGDSVTAAGIAWNNILEPDESLRDVGFCVNRGAGSAPTTYTLNVSNGGSGSGTVTSSPAGINCGSACSATYATGTNVTLTATPASSSTFVGWSGGVCSGTGTCTVTMDAAKSVAATFNLSTPSLPVTLQITSNWTTGGPSGKGGYCANVIATNNTSAPVDWKVTFPIPAGTIYNFWNAIWSQSGTQVTAEGLSWNNILQPGQTTQSVGFCANR